MKGAPVFFGHQGFDLALRLEHVLAGSSEAQSIGNAMHMRVDGEGGLLEPLRKDHLSRFPSHPWKLGQLLKAIRHPSQLFDSGGRAHEGLGLAVEEATRMDDAFHFLFTQGQDVVGCAGAVFRKKQGCDQIHPGVGALSGKDHG